MMNGLLEFANWEHVEAFGVGCGCPDERPCDEAHTGSGSENDVVRDVSEDGLPMDHQVPVADRYPRRYRHLFLPILPPIISTYLQVKFMATNVNKPKSRGTFSIMFSLKTF